MQERQETWGRSPGVGNGNPLQYSSLDNPMDRGAWQARAHKVAKSRTRLKRLSTHAETHVYLGLFLCVCILHPRITVMTKDLASLTAQSVKNLPAVQEAQV